MTTYAFYKSPFGLLKIGAADGKVILVGIVSKQDEPNQPTPLSAEVYRQLQEYFAGKRTVFTVPYALNGTSFQQAVWTPASNRQFGRKSQKSPTARPLPTRTSHRLLINRAPFRQQAGP